jgi:hypothetical protein
VWAIALLGYSCLALVLYDVYAWIKMYGGTQRDVVDDLGEIVVDN